MLFSVFYVGDSCQGWGHYQARNYSTEPHFSQKITSADGFKKGGYSNPDPPPLKQERLEVILRSFLGKFIQLF